MHMLLKKECDVYGKIFLSGIFSIGNRSSSLGWRPLCDECAFRGTSAKWCGDGMQFERNDLSWVDI